MKNEKEATKQFKITEFHSVVLLPILSENENKDKVIEKLQEFDKIILAFVMDSESKLGTASAGTKIKNAERIIDELKKKLKDKEVKDYIEWGTTAAKLKNIGMLEKAKKVMLVDTQRCKKELEENFTIINVKTIQ